MMLTSHIWALAFLAAAFTSSGQASVDITAKPNLEIKEGNNLRVDCHQIQGQPHPDILWELVQPPNPPLSICQKDPGATVCVYGSTKAEFRERIEHPNDTSILLKTIRSNESGDYRCTRIDVTSIPLPSHVYPNIGVVAPPFTKPTAHAPSFVKVTQTATLTCTKTQQTGETVRLHWWRSDGQTVRGSQNETSGVLAITGVQEGDAADYGCTYTNMAGSLESDPVKLVVHYPPKESPDVNSSSSLQLYEGDQISITCQVNGGFPLANLSWTCTHWAGLTSGSQTSTSTTVTRPLLGEARRALDDASCTCEAQHDAWHAGSPSRTVSVSFTVYYPPGDPTIAPATPLLENEPQTMTCQSEGGKPPNQYQWSPGDSTGSSLQLTPSKENNGMELTCTVSNAFTENRPWKPLVARLTLNVEYRPRVTLQSIASMKENQTLWMNCSADSNPPAEQDQQYEWTLPSGGKKTGSSLGLVNLKKDNAGQYTCTVTVRRKVVHEDLTGQNTTALTVQYLHMTEASKATTVIEGGQLTIQCTAEGVPNGTFSPWNHTGPYLGPRQIWEQTDGRTIHYTEKQVNYTHTGVYTCRVSNSAVPDQQRDIFVTVEFPPKNETHRPEGEVIFTELGEDVALELTVFAYPDNVTFTWFMQPSNSSNFTRITNDDEKFDIAINGLTSRLTVVNTTINELASYTVSVDNGVLKASKFLYVVKPQGCPTEVSIEGTEGTAVSLTTRWRPGYNSGFSQNITVSLCNMTTEVCEVKETHQDPEYNQPMTTQWLGLLDNSCYNIQIEAHNGYNKNKQGTTNGCTVTTEAHGCTKVKPVVEKGKFQVVYKGSTADLSWSLPSNQESYTHQEIEQQELANRRRREVKVCDPPSCHRVPKNQTNLEVPIEQGVRYSFTLVLYDGEVPVYSVPATEVAVPGPPGPPSPVGAIAGGVTGGLLAVIVIVIVVIVFLRRKQILGKGGSDGVNRWLMRKSKDQNGGTTNPAFSDTEAHGNSEGAGPYLEVGSSQTSLAHAGPVDDGAQLYAQPDKGKKNKKKQQGAAGGAAAAPELYAEVNKKGKKAALVEAPVLYAEVNKKGKAPAGDVYAEVKKGKKKDEQPAVYAEVNKKGGKKDKKDKKKGKKGKDEPEPTLYENIPKNSKGQKKKAVGQTGTEYEDVRGAYANMSRGAAGGLPDDEGAYSEVQARLNPDTEITSPPPGSDGLTYMELEIRKKPRDSAPKPVIAPKPDATVYADIDLTRRVDPLPPDPPPSGDNKDKGQGQ